MLDLLRGELIRDEGLKLNAYKDSVGLWTIGVGHLLGVNQRMLNISMDEAMALLDRDIETATIVVAKLLEGQGWPSGFSDARQRALINMAFNLGPTRLAGFKKFLDCVKRHQWDQAAIEMMDSKWATQVGARATRLRDMILNG